MLPCWNVVLTFDSVNTILWSYQSNKTSSAVFSLGATCFSEFYNMKFEFFFRKLTSAISRSKMVNALNS